MAWLAAGCSPGGAGDVPGTAPTERSVTIETTGCGHASATTGSGVIVGVERVLTAAHVVVGADQLRVSTGGTAVPGQVVLLDRSRDLALLHVAGVSASPVELTQLARGEPAEVLGAATGPIPATVTRRLQMTVDDVRSTERSRRAGYELDVRIDGGDSGAGLFAGDRLAGIVFAVPAQRDATFAVRADEVEAVLEAGPERPHACDPGGSMVVPVGR